MIVHVPEAALPALFSPNLMRTLINQSKKEDRFLHSAALAALQSVQSKVQHEPVSALPVFVALTSKNGSIDFDKITKTKTLEQILLSADDDALKKMVRHLNSMILRPESEEQVIADSRRQVIADLLLNTVKHYRRYEEVSDDFVEQDGWLRKTLEIFVDYAYLFLARMRRPARCHFPHLAKEAGKCSKSVCPRVSRNYLVSTLAHAQLLLS
jgi:DNA polymerase phi